MNATEATQRIQAIYDKYHDGEVIEDEDNAEIDRLEALLSDLQDPTPDINLYLKENWSPQFKADFEAMPEQIKNIAGDLFEIKWYGYGGLAWELEHNILGTKEKADKFMQEYNKLTDHQRNLIYYAYEA